MNIGFYNPYFDSLGGGERYVLTLASHWAKQHDVDLFCDDLRYLKKAEERLHIDVSRIRLTPNIFSGNNILKKALISGSYDLIFFLTDGSIPTTLAKRNILHFQVPFVHVSTPRIKRTMYRYVVCNSNFTRDHLDPGFGAGARVIYPPVVPIPASKGRKKQKMILTVGRFNSLYEVKKQRVLIGAFDQAQKDKSFAGWKLVLAGGVLPTDESYVRELMRDAAGLPIEFRKNCSYDELVALYNASSFYWHAAGYGETDPTRMEHFGISAVEAMSAGSVPLVYNGGGLGEIVTDSINGFLWTTTEELLDKTRIIMKNTKRLNEIAHRAKERANTFDTSRFCNAFDELLAL